MVPPKQTDPQFKLRLTPELKAQIEKFAKVNNRSLNAEIISRLERSFDKHFVNLPTEGMAEVIKRLEDTANALEDLFWDKELLRPRIEGAKRPKSRRKD
jgi:hypothetical protein